MERKLVNVGAPHICTAAQMRTLDKNAIETTGISGIVLMENAAIACVGVLSEHFDIKNTSFAVFCGKGNNGGDGFAIARHLFNKGADVVVYLTAGSSFEGDALTNYRIIRSLGITIIELDNSEYLKGFIKSADCVIDAILGTGISGAPYGMSAYAIEAINEYADFVFSVDVPSGINSDTGDVRGCAVKADITVTFAAYKSGMFLYPAAEYMGEIILKDISIPQFIADTNGGRCFLSTWDGVKKVYPKRTENSHKGDYGKILVIGGSVGMAGAVAMSAKAALKCGAGLVTAAVPTSINNIIQEKIDEVMTIPLPEDGGRIAKNAAERLARRANVCDAVLFGPGLGRSNSLTEFTEAFLPLLTVPTVIDADGLYAISQRPSLLQNCRAEIIMTPHSSEMGYLIGKTAEDVEKDRLSIATDYASKNGITLILKGHHTIITAPDGDVTINTTGNSGMAGAGSGDILSGMITALIARDVMPYDAAVSAVYLHGKAGDFAAEKLGKDSMCAGDIISAIPQILPVEKQTKL
ncbi:MAG: NAD(P)H-hydrate dehydratase [Eubacteriales bacterium]|nr:NAD(P)H-hydrate dehydratase [Eubacteriales bacterium]